MSAIASTHHGHWGGLPSRGTILCVFRDEALIRTVEPAIARRGFSLLRARSSMQGFWMAVTAKPDVIITDLPVATAEKDYLLDCVRHNETTASIPVLVLTSNVQQDCIGPTCLRHAARCLLKRSNVNQIVGEAVKLITAHPAVPSGTGDRVIRFDSVGTPSALSARVRSQSHRSKYRQRDRIEPTKATAATQDRENILGDEGTWQEVPPERLARYLAPGSGTR